MTPIPEIIFSGFVSKAVNEIVDVSKDKIRKAVENKNSEHQNIKSQIYNIVIDVLNKVTYNMYENDQDKIYDTAEAFLKSFKKNEKNEASNLTSCLRGLGISTDEDKCLEFKESLCEELGRDEYGELFRAILLLLLDQKSRYDNAVYEQLNQKLDEVILILNQKRDGDGNSNIKPRVESRTQEYADKWNQNMFLNNFDKRDENAGVNVKLSDVYLEEHLPHYIWEKNGNPSTDLKDLIFELFYGKSSYRMLLILGQPGIGKSTLITWIVVNFIARIEDILVYQFATDLKNIKWQDNNVSEQILEILCLSYNDLKNKILILDGFDEVNVGDDRIEILDKIYSGIVNLNSRKFFSLHFAFV